jgi:hypothetical protein
MTMPISGVLIANDSKEKSLAVGKMAFLKNLLKYCNIC